MYQEKLSLDKALHLQSIGEISLIDASPSSLSPIESEFGTLWKNNFHILQSKAKHIPTGRVLEFYSAKYIIEIPQVLDPYSKLWRYLHGIENTAIKSKSVDNLEYVYILINPSHPSIVKIGITKLDVLNRVNSINTSGVVTEWIPKFAVPLKAGTAFKVESAMHKFFASKRVSSDLGSSREFFNISALDALDKLREIAALNMIGNVILY